VKAGVEILSIPSRPPILDPTSRPSRRPASPRPEVCLTKYFVLYLRTVLYSNPAFAPWVDCLAAEICISLTVLCALNYSNIRHNAPRSSSQPVLSALNPTWKSLERMTDLKICARLNHPHHPHHPAIILTAASGFPSPPLEVCSVPRPSSVELQ
jgi:hypothetical protein